MKQYTVKLNANQIQKIQYSLEGEIEKQAYFETAKKDDLSIKFAEERRKLEEIKKQFDKKLEPISSIVF